MSLSQSRSGGRPRITITRAPTVDQTSSLEFLYNCSAAAKGPTEAQTPQVAAIAPRRRRHVFVNLDGCHSKEGEGLAEVSPPPPRKFSWKARRKCGEPPRLGEFSVALALSRSHGDFGVLMRSAAAAAAEEPGEEEQLKIVVTAAASLQDVRAAAEQNA